ncbi:hypothetical protein J3459_012093 [Metarhizium acridum]|uniref:uncharacterized protein n=1 Tax=Metarhizium acridum TaxID=92637 RepID=UPI001C6BBB9D|nr:hypothetical protein J3458_021971 [Metarhizium acridum]KAG8418727.1 hypothetical protein J3459_012093 [Metarhizium acridum]
MGWVFLGGLSFPGPCGNETGELSMASDINSSWKLVGFEFMPLIWLTANNVASLYCAVLDVVSLPNGCLLLAAWSAPDIWTVRQGTYPAVLARAGVLQIGLSISSSWLLGWKLGCVDG